MEWMTTDRLCYVDREERSALRQVGSVRGEADCKKYAEEKGYPIVGLQRGGECYVESDQAQAAQYGAIEGVCPVLGGAHVNRIHIRQDEAKKPAFLGITHLRISSPTNYVNLCDIMAKYQTVIVPLERLTTILPLPADTQDQIVFKVIGAPRPIDMVTVVNRQDTYLNHIVGCVLEALVDDKVVFKYKFEESRNSYDIPLP